MKVLLAALLTIASTSAFAAQSDTDKANSFSCMSAKSFEINAECMSQKIEMSDSFMDSQAMVFESSTKSNNAMASLSINPKTLDIEVVAHKDAYLAKLNQEK